MNGLSIVMATAALLGLTGLPAFAQTAPTVNKTWVSSTGTDSGSCQLIAPCKTFAYAISETNAGGEIDVKDSGAYGALSITKSVSIIADGVVASVGVAPSGISVDINLPTGSIVTLHGLTINPHGFVDYGAGIRIEGNGYVVIDHAIISENTTGIYAFNGFVMITNSLITANSIGIRNDSANVYVGANTISTNGYGLYGAINSYGNNQMNGNTFCDKCYAQVTIVTSE